MSKVVVFGAGGRAGRLIVNEAARRGHAVTAVVRDPVKHLDIANDSVTVVAGDVTSQSDIARHSANCAAVVSAVARMDTVPTEFFSAATHALVDGLRQSGVKRLLLVGIGTTLSTPGGFPVHDSEGFPAEGRAFSLGHSAELAILQADGKDLDWLVLAPPPVLLDADAEPTGSYRLGGSSLIPDAGESFSYADLAVAIIDEIDTPRRHRELVAVAH